ncbi:MAG: YlxR family protein [Lachnospiraceae bacterium]|nr:YlxR family protein [Lachnospiraceae bacterium]
MSTKKKVPLRQCVGCGEMKPKKEMVRIIKTAEDEILMDTTGKKNGRGAYICKSSACLTQARKNRGLERSLKSPIAPEIYELLQKEMEAFEE